MRYTSIFNVNDGGERTIDPGRERLQPNQVELVADYLSACPMVMRCTATSPDILDPTAGSCVRSSVYTDGEWIWDESMLYYVQKYALSPKSAFISSLRDRNFRTMPVSEDQRRAALAAFMA